MRPTPEDIQSLIRTRGLCVSLVLPTQPAGRLLGTDLQALRQAARHALQLLADRPSPQADSTADNLRTAVADATRQPSEQGLAIFAHEDGYWVFHLPVPVMERTAVDSSFATREVIAALQYDPEFLLLQVDARAARLYHYNRHYLAPTANAEFPIARGDGKRSNREATRRFLRTVDASLSRHIARQDLPLVVVGGERALSEFLKITRVRSRMAGFCAALHTRNDELLRIGRRIMSDFLQDEDAAVVDLIDAQLHQDRVITGLLGCWYTAATVQPELLVVERSFYMPAKSHADGLYVEPWDDRDDPEALDDAVDDLIETVLRAGGEVTIVPDGYLQDHGRVALATSRA